MGKASRLKAQRREEPADASAPSFWVVIGYPTEDDGGEMDFVGCSDYRKALALIKEVAPVVDYFGPLDERPHRGTIDGVLGVDLLDFEGRVLWSSRECLGTSWVMRATPVEELASGQYVYEEVGERYRATGAPPRIVKEVGQA